MSPDLRKDKTDNTELIKKTFDYPEMTVDEYNSIPFNNKVTFVDGVVCRMFGSSFPVGGMATYYICKAYNDKGNTMLKPVNVWLVENKN